jgi:hypothetical protein
MTKNGTFLFTLVLSVFLSPVSNSFAAKFANQFIEFELPPQWECKLEVAEWVCQSLNEQKKKEAIIVMAAKLRGEKDSLGHYLEHLKGPKFYTSIQGQPVKSEPKYAKETSINDHTWIDSLHMESEVPGFFTRYLATVKEDIGVLVTFSVHQDKYQEYLNQMEALVTSLRVFRKPGALNGADADANLFKQIQIPEGIVGDSIFPKEAKQEVKKERKKAPESDDSALFLLLIAGAIGFILWKKKRG